MGNAGVTVSADVSSVMALVLILNQLHAQGFVVSRTGTLRDGLYTQNDDDYAAMLRVLDSLKEMNTFEYISAG